MAAIDTQINLRVSSEEYKSWKERAEDEGLSFSVWARRTLNSGADVVAKPVEPVVKAKAAKPKKAKVTIVAKDAPRMKIEDVLKRGTDGKCLNRLPKGSYCKQCGSLH